LAPFELYNFHTGTEQKCNGVAAGFCMQQKKSAGEGKVTLNKAKVFLNLAAQTGVKMGGGKLIYYLRTRS
jgi:hypothetical protein